MRKVESVFDQSEFSSRHLISASGSIYSATSLDYETNRLFSFLVESSDGVHISQTTVHILVDDVNDNSPLYISEPGGQDRLAVVSTSAASGGIARGVDDYCHKGCFKCTVGVSVLCAP